MSAPFSRMGQIATFPLPNALIAYFVARMNRYFSSVNRFGTNRVCAIDPNRMANRQFLVDILVKRGVVLLCLSYIIAKGREHG